MEKEVTIVIPEYFLLTIAVYGKMGDGELPDLMRTWAQNECKRLGIEEKMVELQKERLQDLETRIRNVLGNDVVNSLKMDIGKVMTAINKTNKKVWIGDKDEVE